MTQASFDAAAVVTDAPSAKPLASPTERLASIDAYRGLVMFLMMAEVLNFCEVAGRAARARLWELLCHHQSHVEWVGCTLHDLIQPSFSFLVGVALPFSLAGRLARGQSKPQDDSTRLLAVADPGVPGGLPAVARQFADQFHVRGYAEPDRPWLHVLVRARLLARGESSGARWRSSWSATGRRSLSIRSPAPRLTLTRSACRPTGRTIPPGSRPTGTRTATRPGRSTPGS